MGNRARANDGSITRSSNCQKPEGQPFVGTSPAFTDT
jgi:hypothetical protein